MRVVIFNEARIFSRMFNQIKSEICVELQKAEEESEILPRPVLGRVLNRFGQSFSRAIYFCLYKLG